jgi:hypothetical protein
VQNTPRRLLLATALSFENELVLNRDKISGSNLFELQRFRGAGNSAKAAAEALFRIDSGQIVIYSNGIEKASFQTGFTACAGIGVHYGRKTAGSNPFLGPLHDRPVQTTVLAAITNDMAYNLAIVDDVNESLFLAFFHYLHRLVF